MAKKVWFPCNFVHVLLFKTFDYLYCYTCTSLQKKVRNFRLPGNTCLVKCRLSIWLAIQLNKDMILQFHKIPLIIYIVNVIIKITISSNLIDSFNSQFIFNLTAKSFIGECPIAKCCYRTPVVGQFNKPITTRVPGFLTNQQQENSYYEQQQPTSEKLWPKQNGDFLLQQKQFFKHFSIQPFLSFLSFSKIVISIIETSKTTSCRLIQSVIITRENKLELPSALIQLPLVMITDGIGRHSVLYSLPIRLIWMYT